MFPNLDLFPSSGEGREKPTLLGSTGQFSYVNTCPRDVTGNNCGEACTEWNSNTIGGDKYTCISVYSRAKQS
jgi:hypothetical protein